jgi:hypothetical protein
MCVCTCLRLLWGLYRFSLWTTLGLVAIVMLGAQLWRVWVFSSSDLRYTVFGVGARDVGATVLFGLVAWFSARKLRRMFWGGR